MQLCNLNYAIDVFCSYHNNIEDTPIRKYFLIHIFGKKENDSIQLLSFEFFHYKQMQIQRTKTRHLITFFLTNVWLVKSYI